MDGFWCNLRAAPASRVWGERRFGVRSKGEVSVGVPRTPGLPSAGLHARYTAPWSTGRGKRSTQNLNGDQMGKISNLGAVPFGRE